MRERPRDVRLTPQSRHSSARSLECAFLTLAVPLGFDTILCTPWRNLHPLPDDNHVLAAYKNILEQASSNALRAVRKRYRV
jgi:5-methyltetrahydrofolate--homocysteine methyltransferase